MEILKPLPYKTLLTTVMSTDFEEMSLLGLQKYTRYKLILKCHEKYYEFAFECDDRKIIHNFVPMKINDIEDYIKREKNTCQKIKKNINLEIERDIKNNILLSKYFTYDFNIGEFTYFDANCLK